MIDFIRYRLFDQMQKKILTFDDHTTQQFINLDYELNKIGVNLNQIDRKINTYDVYQYSTSDRKVFNQVLKGLQNCVSVLKQNSDRIF
ncbi:MAG: MobC family plasmid mobilization relaxosome protein [Mariniphaga sp.]|nr:MobC family plasmid mobilization relaxosome protein [Mariniphaga sp.]